jgi:hypothetical protein
MKDAILTLFLATVFAVAAAGQEIPEPPPVQPLPPVTHPVTPVPPLPPVTYPLPPVPEHLPAPTPNPVPVPIRNYPTYPSPPPPPPPPSLPVFVITKGISCNADTAYRRRNPDCGVYALRSLLVTLDLGRIPEARVENARANSASISERQHFSNAEEDLREGVKLLRSGDWSAAHRMLAQAYEEIENSTEISDSGKATVRSLMEFSSGSEELSNYHNAAAREEFHRSYLDAKDSNIEAAALFSEAQAEINALHQHRALSLLNQAYGKASGDLKSNIMLAKAGVLTSLNGYHDPEADRAARQAMEDAESAQQRASATTSYAAFVHNVDPARARLILDHAEALCNSDAQWARNQRQAIDQYRKTWGG